MPAEIESFASLREEAWHKLGTVFTKPVTADELMELANLNGWNVRCVEIDAPDFNMNGQKYYFVVRDNHQTGEVDVLSTAGQRYTPFQNESLFYMGHDLQQAGLGRWETAGSLKSGRVVFGSLSIDREVVLDPTGANDVIKNSNSACDWFCSTDLHDPSVRHCTLLCQAYRVLLHHPTS